MNFEKESNSNLHFQNQTSQQQHLQDKAKAILNQFAQKAENMYGKQYVPSNCQAQENHLNLTQTVDNKYGIFQNLKTGHHNQNQNRRDLKLQAKEGFVSQIVQQQRGLLPSLETIDFDIVRMCIAPSKILKLNSKSYLEKRTHQVNFKELSFMLEAEQSHEGSVEHDKCIQQFLLFQQNKDEGFKRAKLSIQNPTAMSSLAANKNPQIGQYQSPIYQEQSARSLAVLPSEQDQKKTFFEKPAATQVDSNDSDCQIQSLYSMNVSPNQEEKDLSIFNALQTVQERVKFFRENPSHIPTSLDPSIESYYTVKQQKNRLKMFLYLTDQERDIAMDKIILSSAQKINHGKFHNRYRGSLYRGVSRNGKSWQILIMIDSEKIYLCTTDNPYQAAILYDYVIIQAKGLGSKINFEYSKLDLLAILFEKSIVQVKKQKTERDQIEQQRLFGFHENMIESLNKNQQFPVQAPQKSQFARYDQKMITEYSESRINDDILNNNGPKELMQQMNPNYTKEIHLQNDECIYQIELQGTQISRAHQYINNLNGQSQSQIADHHANFNQNRQVFANNSYIQNPQSTAVNSQGNNSFKHPGMNSMNEAVRAQQASSMMKNNGQNFGGHHFQKF